MYMSDTSYTDRFAIGPATLETRWDGICCWSTPRYMAYWRSIRQGDGLLDSCRSDTQLPFFPRSSVRGSIDKAYLHTNHWKDNEPRLVILKICTFICPIQLSGSSAAFAFVGEATEQHRISRWPSMTMEPNIPSQQNDD